MSLEEAVTESPIAVYAAITTAFFIASVLLYGLAYVSIHVLRIPRILPRGYELHIKPSFEYPGVTVGSLGAATLWSWVLFFVPCHTFRPDMRHWWSGVGVVWLVAVVVLAIFTAVAALRHR